MGARRWALGWALVIALAVALRVWMWSFQAGSGAVQPGDPHEYYLAALHLLQGGYHDTGKWLRPPLYPLFLALCMRLLGPDIDLALLAQAVATGLAAPAFGWLALSVYGRRDLALLAGLIAALLVPLAHFGSTLFAEGLFVTLVALMLAALTRARDALTLRAALLAGALLGLAALTRAVALSFLPLALLALLAPAGAGWAGWRQHLRVCLRPAAGLLLGAAIVIAPWAARNALAHQRLILSDTNGGISMWYGTVRSDAEQLAGEAQLWATPNLADRQALALRWTIAAVRADPLWFVERMRFKVASLYLLQIRSYAVGDVITISPQDEQVALGAGESPLGVSAVADAQYVALLLLAVVGLARSPDRRRLLPIVLWVLFITFMSAITIGHPRLRVPVLAALIAPAAYGAQLIWARAGRPTRAQLALVAAGWLLVAGLTFSTRYIGWARSWGDLSAARAALAAGQTAAARAHLEAAQRLTPGNALRALDLADLALREGDLPGALDGYAAAIALEDRSLYAHAMRARVAGLLGRADVASAEQRALAGYGRDTNEVYRWAWERWGDPPQARVVPGSPTQIGQYVGFAPATSDLAGGRWTLGDGRVRLAGGCGAALVRLSGPAGRAVTISAEGRAATLAARLGGGEQTLRLELPCAPGAAAPAATTLRIQSEVGLLDIARDPWYVGVAVREAWMEGTP